MSQHKIWDYFQNEGVASFFDAEPRQRFLAGRLGIHLPPHSRVLNIGIGGGTLEQLLYRRSFLVSALDPNRSAVERLRSKGIDARVGFAEELPFHDREFDAVIASEVLEHLDDDELARTLAEIHRVLKAGALFIGTVPFNERLADGLTVCPNCGHQYHRWGHRRSFTKPGFKDALCERFRCGRIEIRSFVSWGGGFRRQLKSMGKWILGRIGEPIASPHLYFECRRPVQLASEKSNASR